MSRALAAPASEDKRALLRQRLESGEARLYPLSFPQRELWETSAVAVEDPATGSAVGPLCAYLDHHAGISSISVEQGAQMGRPSRLEARIDSGRARVGGDCVIVLAGTVSL